MVPKIKLLLWRDDKWIKSSTICLASIMQYHYIGPSIQRSLEDDQMIGILLILQI